MKDEFIKKFPSLINYLGNDRVLCVTIREVQKHCLDKAKVKEALRKHLVAGIADMGVMIPIIEKELGI
jgi:hypothetical protein